MPFGRYVVLGQDGGPIGTEEFRCAPGPMGWRYFGEVTAGERRETLDFAVDADWRIARLRIATGEHDILLEPRDAGTRLVGYRDREPIEIAYGSDVHLSYHTPATSAITARRLTGTSELDVVVLEPGTLEPRAVRHRYEWLDHERVPTPIGEFDATRWRFTALDAGWTGDLWAAGDLVVAYEGMFELDWLDPGASGPRPVD